MKGGSVQNPIHALAQFIDELHAPNSSLNVEGFYRYAMRKHACVLVRLRVSRNSVLLSFGSSMASGPWFSSLADRQISKPMCVSWGAHSA